MRSRLLASVFLVTAIGATVCAQDKPLERTDLDRRIVKIVYDAARQGTDLFNMGNNHEGCFRLYQGTLLAVQPMLDHRPKLAASVKEKMDKAVSMKASDGAHELRLALDEIQHEIAPGPKADPKSGGKVEPKITSLWTRLGGEAGVKKVVDDLITVAIEDKDVNLLRGGTVKLDFKGVAAFKQKLVEFISESTGGPLKYTGKDMKTVHAGMKITGKEFDALVKLLEAVLKKNKVAQADIDELVKVVGTTKAAIVEAKGN